MKILKLAILFSVCLSSSPVMGDFFDIKSLFEAAAGETSKSLAYVEDFENNNVPANSNGVLLPPAGVLEFGVPLLDDDGLGFPVGLGTDLITIDPFGVDKNLTWALIPDSALNGTSAIRFGFGTQIDFTDDSISAFGFDVNVLGDGPTPFEVRNTAGDVLFSENVISIGFLGFVADPGDSIGSITFGDPNEIISFPQIDNLQFWQGSTIPEPNSVFITIAAFSGLALRRKRR